MRVFLDTNVLVSAFATRGLSADLFEMVLLEHELVTGKRVLQELQKALRTKIKLPRRQTVQFWAKPWPARPRRLSPATPPSWSSANWPECRY